MSGNRFLFIIILLVGMVAVLITSCSRENIYTGTDATLLFSLDTVRFDTVFTQKGSATRILKVYNPYSEDIIISSIGMEKGDQSLFRLNVDGLPMNSASDIPIAGGDSLYIFAEVTIDPDQPLSSSPFVIEEWLHFTTNGNEQQVLFEAWGQNANYVPRFNGQGDQVLLSCNLGEVVWDDPRPYVIYGLLAIDSCTLTIAAGTDIYVHGGIVRTSGTDFYNDGILFTLERGILNIKGTVDQPVTIQSDRLETDFEKVSGQYSGIRLGRGSIGPHTIEHAHIRHAIVGVYADSASTLNLKNSILSYCSSAGMAAVRANVTAENCLFHNNDGGGIAMVYGGQYNYKYCTVSNLNSSAPAIAGQNFICYDPPFCTDADAFPIQLEVTNSIFVSGGRDAISLSNGVPSEPSAFQYGFQHCLMNVDELLRSNNFSDFFDNCEPCIDYDRNDPLFLDPSENDFSLDTMSVARGEGLFLQDIQTDLLENPRKMPPDLGCYEFLE